MKLPIHRPLAAGMLPLAIGATEKETTAAGAAADAAGAAAAAPSTLIRL